MNKSTLKSKNVFTWPIIAGVLLISTGSALTYAEDDDDDDDSQAATNACPPEFKKEVAGFKKARDEFCGKDPDQGSTVKSELGKLEKSVKECKVIDLKNTFKLDDKFITVNQSVFGQCRKFSAASTVAYNACSNYKMPKLSTKAPNNRKAQLRIASNADKSKGKTDDFTSKLEDSRNLLRNTFYKRDNPNTKPKAQDGPEKDSRKTLSSIDQFERSLKGVLTAYEHSVARPTLAASTNPKEKKKLENAAKKCLAAAKQTEDMKKKLLEKLIKPSLAMDKKVDGAAKIAALKSKELGLARDVSSANALNGGNLDAQTQEAAMKGANSWPSWTKPSDAWLTRNFTRGDSTYAEYCKSDGPCGWYKYSNAHWQRLKAAGR